MNSETVYLASDMTTPGHPCLFKPIDGLNKVPDRTDTRMPLGNEGVGISHFLSIVPSGQSTTTTPHHFLMPSRSGLWDTLLRQDALGNYHESECVDQ